MEALRVRRQQQAVEGEIAMREYLNAQQTARQRMNALRAQRLARERSTVKA
jgi:hypothetical protein